ncbi:MAG: thiamine phosphate synthase [Candidatus Thermoplasmatota archaeon]|nr:thiamine phosphate synthase [Candidatus Thermoplasmatota archaeon]
MNYYYITDEKAGVPLPEQVKLAVENGVKMIQYRRKSGSDEERYKEVKEIKEICEDKALLIIDDRVDIAVLGEADGVHLGQSDLPPSEVRKRYRDILIGVSTHTLEQAEKAEKVADYVGIGPVHETGTKEDTSDELEIQKAKQIADRIDLPTAAIGGIEEEDLSVLSESFDMICAISSVTRVGDLAENIRTFEEKIKEVKRKAR